MTVGSGTQKRLTAVKDDSGTGITLNYNEAPNAGTGLLTSVADPQSRTHTLVYTGVPDETLPTPVNRRKLTSITVKGAGSPNRTAVSTGTSLTPAGAGSCVGPETSTVSAPRAASAAAIAWPCLPEEWLEM